MKDLNSIFDELTQSRTGSLPLIIGITGASGSGKTYLAKALANKFDEIVVLHQDSYYKNLDHIPFSDRETHNFDHPNAFDFDLLQSHLLRLLAGDSVQQPVYDFTTHTRTEKSVLIKPSKIIVLEGILILHPKELVDLMGLKVYIDVPLDIAFIRRLERDMAERDRPMDNISEQYLKSVRPMYLQYILPSKQNSDIVLSSDEDCNDFISLLVSVLQNIEARANSKKKNESSITA